MMPLGLLQETHHICQQWHDLQALLWQKHNATNALQPPDVQTESHVAVQSSAAQEKIVSCSPNQSAKVLCASMRDRTPIQYSKFGHIHRLRQDVAAEVANKKPVTNIW